MINKRIIALVFTMICIAGIIVLFFLAFSPHVLFTRNINDYGADKYELVPQIFLEEIPLNANVVSFSYYNYWNEVNDIYLELKFQSTEEMESYLVELREHSLEKLKNFTPPENGKWFITEQNPYNQSYCDNFCVLYHTFKEGKDYTGYSVEEYENGSLGYSCSFAIISFSYEELTTIQTYVSGVFQDNIHSYTPQYFIRFNVPIDGMHNRVHYISEEDRGRFA